ncbi:NAD(P)H-dependent flavin oxidoreductase [Oceanobacillus halophilus]|uniref:Probable nitronate monooxygenase n=1 Tax=Oceanobacillus halophilus TaxID=930130 RepID=A0A495A7C1_9BACI|nr:nitronate monooxygenase [Oceanobacillus halophilus]RKQ35707.1 nitronate monooxygenase [Oceanobacillus halophilus]
MRNEVIEQLKNSVELPVIMAPMFIISNPKMVINACTSGIIGTFPALNARSGEILENWMEEITTELETQKQLHPDQKIAPWGINFIVHKSNKRYVEDLQLIEKYQPPVVITSLGDPSQVVDIVHGYGGVVFSDVINIKFAKKAIEKGADGLVLVASGAGGHGGTYNPIPFVHEVREFFDGPIALSGGMSKGEDILLTEVLGADFAYIGTRFIPSEESLAKDAYKEMIVDSSIEDITYTDAFSGINANYLVPSIINAGLDPSNLQKKEKIDFSQNRNDVKAWKDIWGAGQGVGPITKIQTVAEIVEELKQDYENAIHKVSKKNTEVQQ